MTRRATRAPERLVHRFGPAGPMNATEIQRNVRPNLVPRSRFDGPEALVGKKKRCHSGRGRDSNMRAVWVCTRNDVMGNLVMPAALGVFGTGTRWPDVNVAAVMARLAPQGASWIIWLTLTELQPDHASWGGPKAVTARIRQLFTRPRSVGF